MNLPTYKEYSYDEPIQKQTAIHMNHLLDFIHNANPPLKVKEAAKFLADEMAMHRELREEDEV
jgi:hypothetical protein